MKGPLFRARTRLHLRPLLKAQGLGYFQVQEALDSVDDELVDLAVATTAAQTGLTFPANLGGPVIDWLKEFFNSEFGKAFLDILMKILLGLL